MPRTRPWYLTLTLVLCMLFGASEWLDGCNTVGFYHHSTDVSQLTQNMDEAKRTAIAKIVDRWAAQLDSARSRRFPYGAASLVLGIAMVVLSARALGGREQARAMLVQVVGVQALLGLVGWFLLADVRAATIEYLRAALEIDLSEMRRTHPDSAIGRVYGAVMGTLLRALPGMVLVRLTASVLVIFALTRARARAFFEAASPSASEQ
jgi:hypothetical protein